MKVFRDFTYVILLTGLGHVISLFFYPFALSHIDSSELVGIADFESSMLMAIALITFGVSSTSARDVALSEDFKAVIYKVQSSRISFSLLISFFSVIYGFLFGFNVALFSFILAPIFALNYDFILYGLGKPREAALVSFVRFSLPMLICFALMFFISVNYFFYIILMVIFLLFSSVMVSKFTNSAIVFCPRVDFWSVYFSSMYVGASSLFLNLLRFGYISLVSGLLQNSDTLQLVVFSKFCLFLVAGRRIVIQFFYNRIVRDINDKFIDRVLFVLGVLSSLMFLSLYFINSSLVQEYIPNKDFILLFALASLVILMGGSCDSKLLLLFKDQLFFWIHAIPIILAGLTVYLTQLNVINLAFAILFAEFLISLGNRFAFLYLSK